MAEYSTEENLIDSEDEFKKSLEDISDIENDVKRFPSFNCLHQYDPHFELGMMFSNKMELREAIHSHAIKNRRSINITKNDKIRVYAKCAAEECEWKLHALKLSGECSFQIKKYMPEHTCVMNLFVKNLKSTWLSTKYMSKIRSDPKRNVKGFRTDIIEDIGCIVSKSKIYRAKAKATQLVDGQAYEEMQAFYWGRWVSFEGTVWWGTTINYLNIERDYEWTFMSDKQKGLIQAFNEYLGCEGEGHIVEMLEWLVEYFMTKMQVNRDRVEEKWDGLFCPRIKKLIEKNLTKTGDCIPIKADNFHYQVSCFDGSKYSVDLKEWTCGCRKWDLSEIPCNHALSAILAQRWDYFDYVHKCYSLATYKTVYAHTVMPLNGRSEWQQTGVIPALPPKFGRLVGRPKRARRMERDEVVETMKKKKEK
ncbi:uncharacterized protein [Henckelia pumila]|uniref:uncharacterized protein n=1 Tax=Henckelia pumila TaxID=405737 RepID=UPI003C6E4AEB